MWTEAAWLVVPRVFLFTFFQNGSDIFLFPVWGFAFLLRLLGYDWELLGHFNISLFFRTVGYLSLGPMDWCMFKYLRWSWTWFSLRGGNCSLQSHPWGSGIWEMWEERLILKAEVKNCWIAQPSLYQFSLVVMSYLSRVSMFTFNLTSSSQCSCRTGHFLLTL